MKLFFNGNTTKSLFDVTMCSFDGAETCELVGLYLLSKLTQVVGNNIGLYRDDGLAIIPNPLNVRKQKPKCDMIQPTI